MASGVRPWPASSGKATVTQAAIRRSANFLQGARRSAETVEQEHADPTVRPRLLP